MTACVPWAFAGAALSAMVTYNQAEQEEACDAQRPQIKPHDPNWCVLYYG